MEVSISTAKARLSDLIRRVESGEHLVLTVARKPDRAAKMALLASIRAGASGATPGPSAARSQDFLYDQDGLPE